MTVQFLLTRTIVFTVLIFGCSIPKAQELPDVAMITALEGLVERVTPKGAASLQSFVKLKEGDLLALRNARLKIVYFATGRQELWQGKGRLEVLNGESRAFGIPNPQVKILSSVMVKQIARTPTLESQGRAGVVRLRSIASQDTVEKLDETYRRMRMEAVHGDLNPELYLLSGLFELREFDRVEQMLRDLQQTQPSNAEVGLVIALYQKAIRNAREARSN